MWTLTHKTISYAFALMLLLTAIASAEVPQLLSYQGRLTDSSGNPLLDGTYPIVFTIWDSDVGGESKWTETQPSVVVTDGLFHVLLGSFTPLPDSVFSQPPRWLSVSVNGEDLYPRTRLASVPYSYYAQALNMAPTNSPGDCTPSSRGQVYYSEEKNEPCYCNGTFWLQFDGGGVCINTVCIDADGDGFDICDAADPFDSDGYPADCDDSDPDVNWLELEVCDDLKDNDCDGLTDFDDPDCSGHEPGVGDLVITEFMANPDAIADNEGEWIEIFNPSGLRITLLGLTLTDGVNSHVITADIIMQPGSYATLAISATPGFTPDYVYTGVALNNAGDNIILQLDALVIDQTTYTSTIAGVSSELSTNHTDDSLNDNPANWCPAVSTFGAGDLGTPGVVNDCAL